jgi:hypothetical protein
MRQAVRQVAFTDVRDFSIYRKEDSKIQKTAAEIIKANICQFSS